MWQNLPSCIDPIAFSFSQFNIYWYGIMYLVGFLVVYLLLRWRIIRKEFSLGKTTGGRKFFLADMLLWMMVGLFIGARLGYAVFYNFSEFLLNPFSAVLPVIGNSGTISISGMSYHGGLAGVVIALFIFARTRKFSFWKLADFIVPAVPAGYFFGRIGNFINAELYGRATNVPWAMDFGDGVLRHPSQLYEALLEGVALFAILWILRNKNKFSGFLFCVYILGYGIARFMVEVFRQPDPQLGFIFAGITMGQVLSVIMIGAALTIIQRQWAKRD